MKKTTKQEKIDKLIYLRDHCERVESQIKRISEYGIEIYNNSQAFGRRNRVWIDNEDVVKEMEDATTQVVMDILKRELRSCRAKMGRIKIS